MKFQVNFQRALNLVFYNRYPPLSLYFTTHRLYHVTKLAYSRFSVYDTDFFKKKTTSAEEFKSGHRRKPLISMSNEEKQEFIKNQWQAIVDSKKSSVPKKLTSEFMNELVRAETYTHLKETFK
jgi:hypothetical protein